MNKYFILIFVFLLTNCSTDTKTGIWSNIKKKETHNTNEKILSENKPDSKSNEINTNIKIKLKQNYDQIGFVKNNSNNYTIFNFDGDFKKSKKYKFSKIINQNFLNSQLLFTEKNEIIYFDGNGSIYKLTSELELIWKINHYSKNEKKLNPVLNFAYVNNQLIVTDSLSNYYLVNLNNGNLIWKKKNTSSFNSHIKILKDKFYVIDLNNILKCYSLENGSQIWEYKSENTFIKSKSKMSLVVNSKQVTFINTLGDLSSLNINTGELIWQIPTMNNSVIEDSFSNVFSDLVESNNIIYFSNNNNQLFSIDNTNGKVNWIQNINAILAPSIIDKLIFIVTNDGYLILLDKDQGSIIRSSNLKKYIKNFEKKKIFINGYLIVKNNIFISLNNGKLLKINLIDAKIDNLIKITKNQISRPYVNNKKMFFITENSLYKYN